MRYEVFNLELEEGLDASHANGRDEDRFDAACHHLLVIDSKSDTVIGTYRMQTREMARVHHGFYSAGEYDLAGIGDEVLDNSVEIGRACIHEDHRNQKVLFGLWRGLAIYMFHTSKRYFFGCCSLTSQDPVEGRTVMARLRRDEQVHPELLAQPLPGLECVSAEPDARAVRRVKLPRLFSTYLRFGAKVCSEPAIDREFKTIDYLVLLDTENMPALQMFTAGLAP